MASYVYIGLATIFIAAFTLFFIFHQLEQLSTNCELDKEYSPLCKQLSGFSMSMLIVLLIVGGFVITITATGYIMLAAG